MRDATPKPVPQPQHAAPLQQIQGAQWSSEDQQPEEEQVQGMSLRSSMSLLFPQEVERARTSGNILPPTNVPLLPPNPFGTQPQSPPRTSPRRPMLEQNADEKPDVMPTAQGNQRMTRNIAGSSAIAELGFLLFTDARFAARSRSLDIVSTINNGLIPRRRHKH